MKKIGALPSQMIGEMMNAGFISGTEKIENNINPASLDLSISEEIYRVEGIFQPRPNEKVRDILELIGAIPQKLDAVFERDRTYLARLNEKLKFPKTVYGYANPKSSTGRNDIHVRVLTDGVSRYDVIPSEYCGESWLAVKPKSYPIKLSFGEKLSQLRFFNADTRFNETELEIAMARDKLLWYPLENRVLDYSEIKIRDNDGSIILTLDLTTDIVCYECLGSEKILDFSKRRCNPEDFFSALIKKKNGYVFLKKGGFYILSTREAVRIPPHLACEMVPMDERSGEFRSHYAGFIDPGWGWGKSGEGKGRQLTLELRPFEDIIVRDNQPICKIKFERMADVPDKLYDEMSNSNYVEQKGPCLSKHFL